MNILVDSRPSSHTCTISDLYIDGDWQCYILEDVVREIPGEPVEKWKEYGKTAIPAGIYRVLLTYSNRFKRILPQLAPVPGFEGVRIHPGNTDADTEGCLLPGEKVADDGESVQQSRLAFEKLYQRIEQAINAGDEVWITINRAGL